MSIIRIYPLCLSLLMVFILATCATVTQPTGGPMDKQPPKLINSIPENGELNFSGNKIILEFDEMIELFNPLNQIIITPRLTEEYEIEYKQNKVTLYLKDELKDTTTYTFSFGNSIQDITERNPAKDLRLSFSTGDYIDSAYIEGTVYDLLTESPLREVLVGLYFAEDTLNIVNTPPDYLDITDESGNFKLTNLAQGKYRIYALNDKNKNSIVDFKNEIHGFIPDTLFLKQNIDSLKISLVHNNITPLNIISARANGKYFEIKYNKYINDLQVEPDSILFYKLNEERKEIKFYNTIEKDSLQATINTIDSTGYRYSDTLYIKFIESPRQADNFTLSAQLNTMIKGTNKLSGQITFSKPSYIFNRDSLLFQLDSKNIIPLDTHTFKWLNKRTKAEFTTDISPYITDSTDFSRSEIQFGRGAFRSIEKDTSFATKKRLTITSPDKLGSIEVSVNSKEVNYIIQLLDTKLNMVEQVENTEKINFSNLKPGNYYLRAIIDSNGNGKWDPGDITRNRTPEPVKFFTYESGEYQIVLRANFIIGPLEFSF